MDAMLNRCNTVCRVYLVKNSGGGVVYKAVAGQKYGRPPKHEEHHAKRHIPVPQLHRAPQGTASLRAGMS
jgi:hypothetical protein